jgi:MFS family permease
MTRKATTVLVCGSIVLLLAMGARYSFGLFLGPVSQDLALDFQVFSFAIALQNLLWGLSQPFAGAIADKYGTGRTIAVSAALYVVGLVVLANADSAWDLHLGSGILVGIAGSGCTFAVVLAAIGRAVPPAKRSLALGIGSAMGTMGQVAVVPINNVIMNEFGWQMAFYATAVGLAAIVPLAAALTGSADDVTEKNAGASSISAALAEARVHTGYMYLTAGFFVCGFQIFFIIAHFPNFLLNLDMPAWLPGWAIAIIGLTNVIGTLGCGWLGGRYSKKYLLSGLYFLRALAFLAFLLVPISVASVLVFSGVIGLLWLGTVPLTSALVGQIFGVRYVATLFGIVFLSHQVGSFIAVWLGGIIFDATGTYDLIWQISIALGVVAAILHLPIAEAPIRRPEPVST